MNRYVLNFALLALLPIAATAGTPPPDWDALDDADRAALTAPLQERWDEAGAEQRTRMLERARRWATMSPEQKARAREGLLQHHRAAEGQRHAMREVWKTLQSLPADEREALRAQWRALSPEQRRAWLRAGGPGRVPPPGQ